MTAKKQIDISATTEKKLYKTVDKIVKKYLKEKKYSEVSMHEVCETLTCVTALYLALYSTLFVEKAPTSHIDYIVNKLDELAFESYIDDLKKGLKLRKK
jgi:hypothetical protein